MELLATKLKQLRIAKKLKQAQVASIVGVNKSAISAYENGLRQPSYPVLVKLANLYRVTTDYLLGREHGKMLDLSGLTEREIAIVTDLVHELSRNAASE